MSSTSLLSFIIIIFFYRPAHRLKSAGVLGVQQGEFSHISSLGKILVPKSDVGEGGRFSYHQTIFKHLLEARMWESRSLPSLESWLDSHYGT